MESKAVYKCIICFQIGFRAANIVDDNQTVVTRAGRLHPEYEGKGLFGYLDEYIAKWANEKQVFAKAFTTSDQNSNISKASFRQANSLILSKVISISTHIAFLINLIIVVKSEK